MVSIHGPLGYEPNTLATAPLRCVHALWPLDWRAEDFAHEDPRARNIICWILTALGFEPMHLSTWSNVNANDNAFFENPLFSRGESGWCSDRTSTPGAWRHAEAQFLLSGVFFALAIPSVLPQLVCRCAERFTWCNGQIPSPARKALFCPFAPPQFVTRVSAPHLVISTLRASAWSSSCECLGRRWANEQAQCGKHNAPEKAETGA